MKEFLTLLSKYVSYVDARNAEAHGKNEAEAIRVNQENRRLKEQWETENEKYKEVYGKYARRSYLPPHIIFVPVATITEPTFEGFVRWLQEEKLI